jgi:hypothetical protein
MAQSIRSLENSSIMSTQCQPAKIPGDVPANKGRTLQQQMSSCRVTESLNRRMPGCSSAREAEISPLCG